LAKVATRLGSVLTVGLVLAAASSTAATSMSACGESGACTNLRQTTYANLEAWQACDPSGPAEQCIPEPGNPKDCTGVLACNFAINARFRAQAEMAVYTIGQQSQGCYLCAVPNCVAVETAICEPVSHRCIGVTQITDGGFVISSSPPEDSGTGTGNPTGNPPTSDAGGTGDAQ
jgi:hypothetical protein